MNSFVHIQLSSLQVNCYVSDCKLFVKLGGNIPMVTNVVFDSSIQLQKCRIQLTNFGQIAENPAWSIGSHKHDFFELHYIDHGSGTNICSTDQIQLNRGMLYIAKPGESHEQRSNPKDPMELFYAGFYVDSLKSIERWELEYAYNLLNTHSRIVLDNFFPLEPIVSRIMRELHEQREHTQIMLDYLFSQLFIELFRSIKERAAGQSGGAARPPSNSTMIRSTVDYMKHHLNQSFDIDFFAKRVNMSTSHFRRLFRQITGEAPAKYFLDLKIEYAKSLLIRSCSVTETADRTGFESIEHFSKTFHKRVGCWPSHYQKLQAVRK